MFKRCREAGINFFDTANIYSLGRSEEIRLNTDRIDFYFVHMFDENTPMEETLRALDDLQAQGKIL